LEDPSDVVVPWSRAEKKMFNHMVNELEDQPINLLIFLSF